MSCADFTEFVSFANFISCGASTNSEGFGVRDYCVPSLTLLRSAEAAVKQVLFLVS